MNNKEILDKASKSATHYNSNYSYLAVLERVSLGGGYERINSYLHDDDFHVVSEVTDDVRSLADIRTIVERDKRIEELEKQLKHFEKRELQRRRLLPITRQS